MFLQLTWAWQGAQSFWVAGVASKVVENNEIKKEGEDILGTSVDSYEHDVRTKTRQRSKEHEGEGRSNANDTSCR
ncbi:hypothetical protein QQP08_022615 [Theobroma cacao]|nr:hypothetical protein QQP08_022615 [Theobroma cacao]